MLLRSWLIALVALFTSGTLSQHDRPAAASLLSIATCPAKTANYITHTLPQLCLASSRVVPTSTVSVKTDVGYSSDSPDKTLVRPQLITTLEDLIQTSKILAVVTSSPMLSTHTKAFSQPAPELEIKSVDQDIDPESDLGSARFLSFEDWKRENLAKSGQAEHVGKSRHDEHLEPRRKSTLVSDTLDSLGDDAEIDLDFAGFAAERPDVAPPGQNARSRIDGDGTDEEESNAPLASKLSRKDAGTTCKERFNYASFDCAATVLKTNSQAKGSSAVLSENKDSYMLNECSAENKFLILELCNDISIDTIVVANFEFFSSIFRTFRVSVSDRYPVKVEKWRTLGTFEARNSREVQAFLVENPLIWARYLRVEFLTHYGSEYYCPISLIRVHGTTMMEDYKHDMEANRPDDEEDEEGTIDHVGDVPSLVPEALVELSFRAEEAQSQAPLQRQTTEPVAESPPTGPLEQIRVAKGPSSRGVEVGLCPYHKAKEDLQIMPAAFNASRNICIPSDITGAVMETTTASVHVPGQDNVIFTESTLVSEGPESNSLPLVTRNASSDLKTVGQASPNNTAIKPTQLSIKSSETEVSVSSSRSSASQTTNASHVEHKSTASLTQPSLASPTIQESFFKSVQKRLQMLESNSSLSLQYIEEQSKNLRDAFGRVEQRQLSKTTTFLEYLNSTVLSELRDFRQQYDQLWQSTVIELDNQREQYEKEVLAINSRLAVLADEVIFQKRMSMLQSILVLICLGIVLFSRGAVNNYLELPIVQNMLARSPSLKQMNSQILQTPTESPAATRPNSSHKQNPSYGILKSHRSQLSGHLDLRPQRPVVTYSPPTPTSFDADSDTEEVKELTRPESPVAEHDTITRPSSSPPVLPGAKDRQAEIWNDSATTERPLTNGVYAEPPYRDPPRLNAEDATPAAKHLSFRLPDG